MRLDFYYNYHMHMYIHTPRSMDLSELALILVVPISAYHRLST